MINSIKTLSSKHNAIENISFQSPWLIVLEISRCEGSDVRISPSAAWQPHTGKMWDRKQARHGTSSDVMQGYCTVYQPCTCNRCRLQKGGSTPDLPQGRKNTTTLYSLLQDSRSQIPHYASPWQKISAFYRAAQSYLAYNSATKAREIQEGLKWFPTL